MARLWRNNSLTIVLMLIFLAFLLGQLLAGWRAEVAQYTEHGSAAPSLGQYASSGAFVSSVFENWESEFLQMSAYVVLTAMLVQKGSAEARAPDEPAREGDEPAPARGPLERIAQAIYARSLGLALAALFLLSFVLHFRYSAVAAGERAQLHQKASGAGRLGARPRVLVRVFSELAERVSLDGRPRRADDLPEAEGLARIEACHRGGYRKRMTPRTDGVVAQCQNA